MHYGTHLFATEHSIQPAEFAKASEDRGFESVWFSEHTHIPVNFLISSNFIDNFFWSTYSIYHIISPIIYFLISNFG